MIDQQRLLLAIAHPDDEAFGAGSMLAKYAAEGAEVMVLCATRGEAGEIAEGVDATPETLGEVREAEIRASLKTLGVASLELLGYRDSGMAGSEDNHRADAFMNAPEDEVVARLTKLMRTFRPQVAVTFDEGGGYGHPDHMLISRTTKEAFSLSSDASFAPPGGEAPWTPAKLYYMVFPRSRIRALSDAIRKIAPDSDMAKLDPDQLGVSDDSITTVVDTSDFADRQQSAAALHRSQGNPFDMFPEDVLHAVMGNEHFIRVYPPRRDGETEIEADLFQGL